jgi:hypothetical protein
VADNTQDDFVDSTPDYKVTSRDSHGRLRPGFTANPSGQPKSKKWFREAFIKHFEEHPEDFSKIIAEVIVAGKGEQTNRFSEVVNQQAAAQFIKDTLDGKAKQEVEVTGEDGGPLHMVIRAEED